ncbi:hypothetical protein ACEQ8H_000458 [Pleosporales sp. CAS-2024a]
MKASLLFSATFLASAAFAFPANLAKLMQNDISDETLAQMDFLADQITADISRRQSQGPNVKRDFTTTPVENTGAHAYIAPGPNDLRGPCPGLNTMANHGYINRSGWSSAVELATASNQVFGMGIELSTFLAVYSAIIAGDLTSVSIGGKPANAGLVTGLGSSLGLLGEPQGLSLSHNRFEADASPVRGDLYSTGDAWSLNLGQFEKLAAMPLGANGYDMSVMIAWRHKCFQNSIATNGRYFAGPWTNYVVNAAAHYFTYRFFANYTSDHPEGYLSLETLKTFEGVKGQPGSFTWSTGSERIPDNWYRRPVAQPYGLTELSLDATAAVLQYPDLVRVGGNMGAPNTFVGVNLDNLTGGVYNAQRLTQGNNLICFGMQFASIGAPDMLKGLVNNVLSSAVSKLSNVLNPILQSLDCPDFTNYNGNLFQQFPGAGSNPL